MMHVLSIFAPLAVKWNVSPELLHIGFIHVRYYGILFILGFILGYYLFTWFYKREGLPVSLLDPLLYVLLGCTLVGARLGHVLFYEPAFYFAHPWKIFAVWEGGLASHGGAIAILLGLWWYARHYGRKYDFDYLWMLDRVGIAIPFAGMFIRLGNLMNSEIYGHVTDLPWGFIFLQRGETLPKHPTQLYEALCYLLTGTVLVLLYKYCLPKMKRGFFFGLFLIGIFASRFFIEFIKEPQALFEQGMPLNMGQLLSIPFVLFGIFLIVRSFRISIPAARVSGKPGSGKGTAAKPRK